MKTLLIAVTLFVSTPVFASAVQKDIGDFTCIVYDNNTTISCVHKSVIKAAQSKEALAQLQIAQIKKDQAQEGKFSKKVGFALKKLQKEFQDEDTATASK